MWQKTQRRLHSWFSETRRSLTSRPNRSCMEPILRTVPEAPVAHRASATGSFEGIPMGKSFGSGIPGVKRDPSIDCVPDPSFTMPKAYPDTHSPLVPSGQHDMNGGIAQERAP